MIYTESYLHPNVFIFNGRLSLSPNGSTDETGGEKRGSRISLKPGEFYSALSSSERSVVGVTLDDTGISRGTCIIGIRYFRRSCNSSPLVYSPFLDILPARKDIPSSR